MPYYNNPNDYQFYQPNQPYQQIPPYYQNNQPYPQTPPTYYPREVEQPPKKMSGRDKAAVVLLVFAVIAFCVGLGLVVYYFTNRDYYFQTLPIKNYYNNGNDYYYDSEPYYNWEKMITISGASCSLLSLFLLNISLLLKKNYGAAFVMIFLVLLFGVSIYLVGGVL